MTKTKVAPFYLGHGVVLTGYFQFILDNTRYVSCLACLIHCHERNTHCVPSESIC